MALWDMLPDQPPVPIEGSTTWEILVEGSLIDEDLVNTAWDHLDNQGGAGFSYLVLTDGLEVMMDDACVDVEIDLNTLDVEVETPEYDIEIDTLEYDVEVC